MEEKEQKEAIPSRCYNFAPPSQAYLLVFSPFLSSAWCCVSAAKPEYETRYSLHTRQPVAAVCVGVAEIELGGAGLT
jgi:hypothetical protein